MVQAWMAVGKLESVVNVTWILCGIEAATIVASTIYVLR